jgi:hypothetical protein
MRQIVIERFDGAVSMEFAIEHAYHVLVNLLNEREIIKRADTTDNNNGLIPNDNWVGIVEQLGYLGRCRRFVHECFVFQTMVPG